MPRSRNAIPTYRLHRASGQAVVTIYDTDGRRRDRLLGRYESAASRAEYGRIIAELSAAPDAGTAILARDRNPTPLTIAEMVAVYWRFARDYYRQSDGKAFR